MYQIPPVFHFKVEFQLGEPRSDNRFQEVTGLAAEVAVEEVREGGLNEYAHKLPTGAKYVGKFRFPAARRGRLVAR